MTTSKKTKHSNHFFRNLCLVIGAIITLFPFIWMLLTSIKTFGETMQAPPILFPEVIQWSNYQEVLDRIPFESLFVNTFIVVFVTGIATILISSLAAYGFTRIDFPGKGILMLLILALTMVPGEIFMIPWYKIMALLHWTNSLQALIVPESFDVFGVFLMYQFYRGIPREMDEAAKIDGAGHGAIFIRIILPLTKSPIVTLAILKILSTWKQIMWPIVVNRSIDKLTIGAGLAQLKGQYYTEQNLFMAAGVISAVPVIVLFIFMQKQFVESIVKSGIKG